MQCGSRCVTGSIDPRVGGAGCVEFALVEPKKGVFLTEVNSSQSDAYPEGCTPSDEGKLLIIG